MAELNPLQVDCPLCGEPIQLPAGLVLDGGPEPTRADILIDLDPARRHARTHAPDPADVDARGPVMSAALATFGIPW
jgi:hypothetical protein